MKPTVFFLLAIYVLTTQAAPTVEDETAPTIEDNLHSTSESSPVAVDDNTNVNHTTQKPEVEDDDDGDKVLDNIVSKLDVLLVEVNDEALQKCISSNNTEALTKARGADEELEKCLSPAFEIVENSISDIVQFDVDAIKNSSQQFCNTLSPLEEKCALSYYNNLEPCLSDGDMKGMKIFDKMVSAAVKYLCLYDPDILTDAAQNGFGCDPLEHIASFLFCIIPPFQEIVHNNHTAMAIPRILLGKGCRLYKNMANCIHEELKTCKNQTYSDIIVGFFNATANALPECPSERTEWEQHMSQVVGQLYTEEQAQTELLKAMKAQMDQLITASTQEQKSHQVDNNYKQNVDKALNSILGILNAMKEEHSAHH